MKPPEAPGGTLAWGPRLAALAVVLAVAAAAWTLIALRRVALPRVEPPIPAVAAATDLTPAMRAEREVELALATQELLVAEARLEALRKQPEPDQEPFVSPAEAADLVRRVAGLEAAVADPATGVEDLYQKFVEIDDLWRQRIESLEVFIRSGREVRQDLGPPTFQRQLALDLAGSPAAERYAALSGRVQQRVDELRARHLRRWEADLQGRAERLRRITLVRQAALARLADLGLLPGLDDPARWSRDVSAEISSYPARKAALFQLELWELRHRSGGDASLGLLAVREIGMQLMALALCLLAVASALRGDRRRLPLGVRSASWAAAWIVAVIAEEFLAGTLADPLTPIPSLLGYFALFRLYMTLVEVVVGPLVERILRDRWPDRPAGGEGYLRALGLIVLGRAVVLRCILALTGPGFLLLAATRLLDFVVPVTICTACFLRREKIAALLDSLGPPPLGPAMARLCTSLGTAWLAAPVGGLLVFGFLAVQGVLLALATRFEGGRRIAAGVLQRWMETLSQPERELLAPPPAPYLEAFRSLALDPRPFWQASSPRFLADLQAPIDDWIDGRSVDSVMAVHGSRGSGRSEVTRHLSLHYGERLSVVQLSAPRRITSEADLLRLVRSAFPAAAPASTAETPEAVARCLRDLPHTLVIVPELSRFFLGTVGGFDAYRALQVVIRLCGPRMLWVLVSSTRSWEYLRAVTAGDEFLTREVRLPRGSDAAVRDLVLRHHEAGGLSYHFGQGVVQAARSTPGATTEDQYFQVLWQLSGGLPTVALELWLASARQEPGGDLRLGLPPRNPPALLPSLPHVATFVLASVTRHDSMTLGELVRATDMGERQVFLTCERLMDLGVLDLLPDQRMRIASRWLRDMDQFLKGRNLADGR